LTGGEEKRLREREGSGSSLAPHLPPPASLFVADNQGRHICVRASKRYRAARGEEKTERHPDASDEADRYEPAVGGGRRRGEEQMGGWREDNHEGAMRM